MRIRRRDREAHPSPQPSEPSAPAAEGPTSLDPVKSLIAEPTASESSLQAPPEPPGEPAPPPLAEPVSEPAATPPAPEVPSSAAAAPVAEALVSSPTPAPEPEAEMAETPKPNAHAAPVVDGKAGHAMRPPSISEDADQLLNGSKP